MTLREDIINKFSALFKSKYKKIGYDFIDIRKIKSFNKNKVNSYTFLQKKIYFKSPFEYLHSLHEIFILEIYKIKLPVNACIIDCGANIGISVLYLKNRFPDSTLIAFEPDKQNFEILNLNIKSFNFKNVEIRNEAVWIEDTYLNFSNESSMSSKISNETNSVNNVNVKAIRLKDIINQKIDFLKIDIEGAEYEVLMDMQDKLYLVQNMFVEYHGSFLQTTELTNIFNILSFNKFNYYIKEAAPVYATPFFRATGSLAYDVQLNIFCFKN